LRSTKAVAVNAALPEPLARAAWAEIIAPELFHQLLVAMDDALAAFDLGLAVESPSGVCSSVQKLTSLFLSRIVGSHL
jgi:hypothetical protein